MEVFFMGSKTVAYLFKKDGSLHIFGFNGEHLGRFAPG